MTRLNLTQIAEILELLRTPHSSSSAADLLEHKALQLDRLFRSLLASQNPAAFKMALKAQRLSMRMAIAAQKIKLATKIDEQTSKNPPLKPSPQSHPRFVIPAKAGIQKPRPIWMPISIGMTVSTLCTHNEIARIPP